MYIIIHYTEHYNIIIGASLNTILNSQLAVSEFLETSKQRIDSHYNILRAKKLFLLTVASLMTLAKLRARNYSAWKPSTN